MGDINQKTQHHAVIKRDSYDSQDILDTLAYTPQSIPHNYAVLDRSHIHFVAYPGQEFNTQPFISWSEDNDSLEFMKDYFSYVSDPVNNNLSDVRDIQNIIEWEELTPRAIIEYSKKQKVPFENLPIYQFFQKLPNGSYRPSHDLICHMLFLSKNSTIPLYLSRWHLGNAHQQKDQFDYYTKFLMKGFENDAIIPNRPTLVRVLQEMVKTIKSSPFSRLEDIKIPSDSIMNIFKAAWASPFGIYESLLRDQLGLVNNITDGNTIWFTLTPAGIIFLFMCCPNEMYLSK
jgi:hypothetical protein